MLKQDQDLLKIKELLNDMCTPAYNDLTRDLYNLSEGRLYMANIQPDPFDYGTQILFVLDDKKEIDPRYLKLDKLDYDDYEDLVENGERLPHTKGLTSMDGEDDTLHFSINNLNKFTNFTNPISPYEHLTSFEEKEVENLKDIFSEITNILNKAKDKIETEESKKKYSDALKFINKFNKISEKIISKAEKEKDLQAAEPLLPSKTIMNMVEKTNNFAKIHSYQTYEELQDKKEALLMKDGAHHIIGRNKKPDFGPTFGMQDAQYIDWLTTNKYKDEDRERRTWIKAQMDEGWTKDKPIFYLSEYYTLDKTDREVAEPEILDFIRSNWETVKQMGKIYDEAVAHPEKLEELTTKQQSLISLLNKVESKEQSKDPLIFKRIEIFNENITINRKYEEKIRNLFDKKEALIKQGAPQENIAKAEKEWKDLIAKKDKEIETLETKLKDAIDIGNEPWTKHEIDRDIHGAEWNEHGRGNEDFYKALQEIKIIDVKAINSDKYKISYEYGGKTDSIYPNAKQRQEMDKIREKGNTYGDFNVCVKKIINDHIKETQSQQKGLKR